MSRIGLVGARGHVGAELIRLVAAHPRFELGFVSSRARDGERVSAHVEGFDGGLAYRDIPHDALHAEDVDAYVLALPNGKAAACVADIRRRADAPVIYAAPDTKVDDFQLAYALDLLRGKMTVASVTKRSAS